MRLIFKTLDARNFSNDDDVFPEKSKAKASSLFRLGGPAKEVRSVEVDDDDESNTLQIDTKCVCNALMLLVSVLVFGASVFVLGAASQQRHMLWPAFESATGIVASSAPPLAQQQQPQQPPRQHQPHQPQLVHEDRGVARQAPPPSSLSVVEMILVQFEDEMVDAQNEAVANTAQCVQLVLEAASVAFEQIVQEYETSVLIRPKKLDEGDLVLEAVSQQDVARKLQACTNRRLRSEPVFTYR